MIVVELSPKGDGVNIKALGDQRFFKKSKGADKFYLKLEEALWKK